MRDSDKAEVLVPGLLWDSDPSLEQVEVWAMTDILTRTLIPHFLFLCYCSECQQQVEVDLAVFGEPGPCFRNVSLLCRSPQVRIDYTSFNSPRYLHRVCGRALHIELARPLLDARSKDGPAGRS